MEDFMKVMEVRTIEDCFDQAMFRELVLDRPVSRDFIFHLGKYGDLEYFSEFPNPFFKVSSDARFTVKGIEGNNTLRLLLNGDIESNLRYFIQIAELFN